MYAYMYIYIHTMGTSVHACVSGCSNRLGAYKHSCVQTSMCIRTRVSIMAYQCNVCMRLRAMERSNCVFLHAQDRHGNLCL